MIHQACINHLLTVFLYLATIDRHSVNHLLRIGQVSGSVGELKANIAYISKDIYTGQLLTDTSTDCQLIHQSRVPTVNMICGGYTDFFIYIWWVDHVWAQYNEVLTAPATCHVPNTNKFTFPENTVSLFCAFNFNFCYTTNIHIMIHVFSKILWSWWPASKSEGIVKYCFFMRMYMICTAAHLTALDY